MRQAVDALTSLFDYRLRLREADEGVAARLTGEDGTATGWRKL